MIISYDLIPNRKPYPRFRMVPFSMILSGPVGYISRFQQQTRSHSLSAIAELLVVAGCDSAVRHYSSVECWRPEAADWQVRGAVHQLEVSRHLGEGRLPRQLLARLEV